MKRGDVVDIYYDPITRLDFEGKAMLLVKISNLGDNLSLWRVRFLDGSQITERIVKEAK